MPQTRRKAGHSKRTKMVLNIDLNEAPPESRQLEERAASNDLQNEHPASHNGSGTVPSAIDADAIDYDVTLPTAGESYAEGWSQIRRKRSLRISIDEDAETNAEHSGVPVEESIPIICPDCSNAIPEICSDCFNNASVMSRMTGDFVVYTEDDVLTDASQVIPEAEKEASEQAAEESALICPICMCELNEPSSTTCGHVFCKCCIENAITKQNECPTCRKKLTMKSFHRIYIPSV